VKQGKQFFFEKKNQKTFIHKANAFPQRAHIVAKVFCFFFSEKKSLLPFLPTLALAACDLAPHYQVPTTQIPITYKEAAFWQVAKPADGIERGSWWRIFQDPELDRLEARVEPNNPTLAAALASFQQARAIAKEAEAGLLPNIGLGSNITTNRQSNHRPLRGANQPNQYLANTVDVQATYEIDLWDQVANSIKAGREAAQATGALLASARLSLQAELASDYVDLRGLDRQAIVLRNAVAAYSESLRVTQARLAGKIASGIDVARAETQLATAQASLTESIARRALLEHAIAVLVGVPPGNFTIAVTDWSLRQPALRPGLPSTLLQRRPDIAAAERQVAASNAQIGVARAAFYPTISLDALYGFQDTGFNLFSLPNDMWTLGPGLALPLFENGLRDAEEAAAIALNHQAAANYRATVLAAFQQVEDALSQQRLLGQEMSQETQAVRAAQRTVDMTTALYKDGAIDYLDVVTAQTAELQAEQTLVDLRTRRMAASVQLVQALGGGWEISDLPKAK
jgi:NodT family efflux transporter outer membrane factor (OMF) lipoprotein